MNAITALVIILAFVAVYLLNRAASRKDRHK